MIVALLPLVGCVEPEHPTAPVPLEEPVPPYLWLTEVDAPDVDGVVVREVAPDDPIRAELDAVLARPFHRWVLKLGELAKERARARCTDPACEARYDHPALFVLKEGGNRPKQGLTLRSDTGDRPMPEAWYVEIDPSEKQVSRILPHEYGHVMLFESLPGDLPEDRAALPHTTGAITDRITALSEGWGIHFETLLADRSEDPALRAERARDAFGVDGRGDSLLPIHDLRTYAQGHRRYGCIKENCFAFLPRTPEPLVGAERASPEDLVARWTDTTYDPARLRTLEQMVASEGVVAALFYRLATVPAPAPDGNDPPLPDPARYEALFDAFASLTYEDAARDPAILVVLQRLLEATEPEERTRIARIALEVFHHTPVKRDAPALYADLHARGRLGALEGARVEAVMAEAADRIEALASDPTALSGVAAPELWLYDEQFQMSLPALGLNGIPLVMDLNTAPLEFLMAIDGLGYEGAQRVVRAREEAGGFSSIAALGAVTTPEAVARVEALHAAYIAATSPSP